MRRFRQWMLAVAIMLAFMPATCGKDTVNAVIHVQLQGQKANYPEGYESASEFVNEPKGLYEQLYKASPEILQEIERYFQYLQEKEGHKT